MARGRPPKDCEVSGCHAINNARGMCSTHYGQWLRSRNGTADGVVREPKPDFDYDAYWNWVKKELKLA